MRGLFGRFIARYLRLSARILLTVVRRQDSGRFGWPGEARPFIDLLAGSDILRQAVAGDAGEAEFGAWLESGAGLEAERVNLYTRV